MGFVMMTLLNVVFMEVAEAKITQWFCALSLRTGKTDLEHYVPKIAQCVAFWQRST